MRTALILLVIGLSSSLSAQIDMPFKLVEVKPVYPGCENSKSVELREECFDKSVQEFIRQNLEYPEDAKKQRLQATVYVSLVIGYTGRIEEAKVLRPIHALLDEEAVRVVKLLPQMQPGKQSNQNVRVTVTVPVSFVLR